MPNYGSPTKSKTKVTKLPVRSGGRLSTMYAKMKGKS